MIVICTASIFLPFYLCYAAFLFALVSVVCRRMAPRVFMPAHGVWFYAFSLLAAVVGALYRHWPGILALALLFGLFLLGFYVQYCMTENIRFNILAVLLWGSFAAVGVAAVQKLLDTGIRTTSLFVNANYYAYICELIIVALTFAVFHYGTKPVYFAAIAANVGGIALSGCRSAWLSVFFGVLVVMLCLKKYRQLAATAAIGSVVGLLVYLLPALLFPRVGEMKSDTNLRVLIWKTAIGYIYRHPLFGQGMITYYLVSVGRAHDTHAHSLFLDPLVNFGVVGTALLGVFVLLYLRDLIKNLHENPAASVALGVMAATFVHGFTDVPFVGAQTGPMLLIMFAFAGGRKRIAATHTNSNKKHSGQ